MNLLLINGPPRSGKDTVGAIVSGLCPDTLVTKFAKILKERTHALYGLVYESPGVGCGKPFAHDYFEAVKDIPSPLFLGKTPRQAYIAVSELLMKPLHGQDIFGVLLAEEVRQYGRTGTVVVTDSGFVNEATRLISEVQPRDTVLIQLSRTGCDFSNDSRGYVSVVGEDQLYRVRNNGSIDALVAKIKGILDQRGWRS